MDWMLITYYIGYACALRLCWSLGRLFWIPMLMNMGFNLSLNFGLLAQWDIRLLMVAYGFGLFLWVLALSQALTRSTLVLVLIMDVGLIFNRLYPDLQVVDTGATFWNSISTHIVDIWLMSIFGLVISMVFRSTVWASMHGRRIDVLTNPKKRFQLPIGTWAAIIAVAPLLATWIPSAFVDNRFLIAANFLTWGWVALELRPYVMNRRLMHSV